MPAKRKATRKTKAKPKARTAKRAPTRKVRVAPAQPRVVGPTTPIAQGRKVGVVTHFYPKISVAVVNVLETIKQGDEIEIRGGSTNIKQRVESMQVEHQQVQEAQPGQSIGLKVNDRVREGDEVYTAS